MKASVIKQNVGVDHGIKKMKVCFAMLDSDQHKKVKSSRSFDNNSQGFQNLWNWAMKLKQADIPLHFTLEATGIYYEDLAYFLYEKDCKVSVQLPNKTKAFAWSHNVKTKTDKVDAKLLAFFGLERRLEDWQPLSPQMRKIKKLTRERTFLLEEKTLVSNQLHAEMYSHGTEKSIVRRFKKRIEFIEKQIESIEKQIKKLVEKDTNLKKRLDNICTIKGVRLITAVTIVAETNGFALIRNRAQLVSYAGYDVVDKQSGESIQGKQRISKKGNKYIRRALYFPAITAVTHDPNLRNCYNRIFDRTKIKMKGYVAIQRKLLLLIYALYKNNVPFDPDYGKTAVTPAVVEIENESRQDTMPAYTG